MQPSVLIAPLVGCYLIEQLQRIVLPINTLPQPQIVEIVFEWISF